MNIRQIPEGAPRFVPSVPSESSTRRVIVGVAQRYVEEDGAPVRAGESLFGEELDLLEDDGAFMRVRTRLDGYVCLIDRDHVSEEIIAPTHYVSVPHTIATEGPASRTKEVMYLGMTSPVKVVDTCEENNTVCVQDAGWVSKHHVREINDFFPDFVDVGYMFLGRPYFHGGRTGIRLDCSALWQNALLASGRWAPRTALEQREYLGVPVPLEEQESLRRGDFVFWSGHEAVMYDSLHVLHSVGYVKAVALEPLREVIARRRSEPQENKREIIAIKRLPDYVPRF